MSDALPQETPPVLGVLLVHGMGEQQRGDTLLQFGEPILTWMRRAIAAPHHHRNLDAEPRILDAEVIRVHDLYTDTPSHLTLRFSGAPGQRILVAESWWANDFRPASFLEVAKWGVRVAPFVLNDTRKHQWSRQNFAIFLRNGQLPLTLILGPVIQNLLLLLLPFAYFPFIRGAFGGIIQRLSNSFGDPYILLASPVRFASMVERIHMDLRWLGEQGCREVTIVAHSQGAAVSHRALKTLPSGSVHIRRFVTFGAAIKKLHLLSEVDYEGGRRLRGGLWANLVVVAVFLMLLFGWQVDWSWIRPDGVTNWTMSLIAVIAVWALGTVAFWWIADQGSRLGSDEQPSAHQSDWYNFHPRDGVVPPGRPDDWQDFWARADPVPLGALPLDPAYTSVEVRNRDSIPQDHTYYWRNPEQFVGPVARAIVHDAGWNVTAALPDDPEAAPERARRVDALDRAFIRSTLTFLVAVIVLSATHGTRYTIERVGLPVRSLGNFLAGELTIPLEAWLRSVVTGSEIAHWMCGALLLLATTMLWHSGAIVAAWERWNATQTDAAFDGTRRDPAAGDGIFLLVGWSVVLVVVIVIVVATRLP